jgi:hypothetical protein
MGRGFKAVDGIPAQSTFQQSESRDATGLFQLSPIGGRGRWGVIWRAEWVQASGVGSQKSNV